MFVDPRIKEEEARDILSWKKSLFSRIIKKKITPNKVELVNLPFYLFEVRVEKKSKEQKLNIALDGLMGNTIFFAGDSLKFKKDSRNPKCQFILSSTDAQRIAHDEFRWILLEQGLRSKISSAIKSISEAKKIIYPFWVGYFQKGKKYDFKALDGISGEIQGVKMRRVFLKAFRHMS